MEGRAPTASIWCPPAPGDPENVPAESCPSGTRFGVSPCHSFMGEETQALFELQPLCCGPRGERLSFPAVPWLSGCSGGSSCGCRVSSWGARCGSGPCGRSAGGAEATLRRLLCVGAPFCLQLCMVCPAGPRAFSESFLLVAVILVSDFSPPELCGNKFVSF